MRWAAEKAGIKFEEAFLLHKWYATQPGATTDKYGDTEQREMLRRVRDYEVDLKVLLQDLGDKQDVLVFNHMDVNATYPFYGTETEAIRLVLEYAEEMHPEKPKVLMLTSSPAWQDGTRGVLEDAGFPAPNTDLWIDMGEAWSTSVESAFVKELMSKCTKGGMYAAVASLMGYFGGHPAYLRALFLPKATSDVEGKPPGEAAAVIKSWVNTAALTMVGNVRDADDAVSRVVYNMLKRPGAKATVSEHVTEALQEAVSTMAVLNRGDEYYVPPMVSDVFKRYCSSRPVPSKERKEIEPVCDAFNRSVRGAAWSHSLLAGVALLALWRR